MQKATCPHQAPRSPDFACPQNCGATSVEGYVGQDFGELSRAAVLVLESGRAEWGGFDFADGCHGGFCPEGIK
jgi:hypothetical protein